MPQSVWRRASQGNTFIRPLGLNELGFYYDSHINGTADTLIHVQLSAHGTDCLDPQNITRAWCALKAQFPLLAATIQIHNSHPHFVVAEERLESIAPNEIFFSSTPSLEEAQNAADIELHGPRNLSDDLVSRLVVLSRTDDSSAYHILINIAHLITDGVGNASLLKEFLTTLASPDAPYCAPNLEARLALAVAAETLVPSTKMSVARQRWRRAAGQIICQLQDAKRTGGQTLPRFYGPVATRLPARSGLLRATLFSPAESLPITQTLRKHGLSVGNALPVLAQVALARVLCRKYLRGEISPEEWAFRKTQPYHTAGPIDLRSLLDKTWYKNGGATNVSLNIGYYFFTLGFASLGPANLAPGDSLPAFNDLMSPARFWLRCNRMKKMASVYLNHPLFFEIGQARLAGKIPIQKQVALKWEKDPEGYVRPGEVESLNLSAIEQVKYGTVMAHGWSSYGDMLKHLPRGYPVNAALPLIRIESHQQLLHCRTGELYLGSGISAGALYLLLFWDKNTFPQETVQEWVDETKSAMLWYLGQALTSKL
ncbi:hypothetical protein C8R46DRAFT_147195 [Mycena filopes]|nr:hypothetical protein C8R46DRAFT_147195 [Mycena filopes]